MHTYYLFLNEQLIPHYSLIAHTSCEQKFHNRRHLVAAKQTTARKTHLVFVQLAHSSI